MNSRYFSEEEQICHCGCGRGVDEVNPLLLRRLDILRSIYGRPIYASCMYRCPEHNADVGGVRNSQHVQGNAADLYVDGDYEEFYDYVITSRLFDGVGYYPAQEFCHVDIRDNGNNPNYYLWEG